MVPTISGGAGKITEDDVARLENRFGLHFPVAYRKFLILHNGGRPTPRAFPVQEPIDVVRIDPFGVVDVFFGIDSKCETSRLDWNYECMAGRLLPTLFPIASDDGGNLICLSLSENDFGSVRFYVWNVAPPEYVDQFIHRIADSFEEFIASFQELPATA